MTFECVASPFVLSFLAILDKYLAPAAGSIYSHSSIWFSAKKCARGKFNFPIRALFLWMQSAPHKLILGCNNFPSGEVRMALFTDSRHTNERHAIRKYAIILYCSRMHAQRAFCTHISLVWFNSQKCYAGWAPPNAELSWRSEDTKCDYWLHANAKKKLNEQAFAMKSSRMNARRQFHWIFGENELWFLG